MRPGLWLSFISGAQIRNAPEWGLHPGLDIFGEVHSASRLIERDSVVGLEVVIEVNTPEADLQDCRQGIMGNPRSIRG